MIRLGMLLSFTLVLIGCSTSGKTILISHKPSEENWYSLWDDITDDIMLSTEKRGAFIQTKWVDLQIGKIGRRMTYYERKKYADINKKVWGFKFIKRF